MRRRTSPGADCCAACSADMKNEISVQLLTTDPNVRPKKQILKASEREGFYKALDVASFWLERALEEV